MQDIKTHWDASVASKKPGEPLDSELRKWFYDKARHNLQFFTFHRVDSVCRRVQRNAIRVLQLWRSGTTFPCRLEVQESNQLSTCECRIPRSPRS
jgi:hypothetical protein